MLKNTLAHSSSPYLLQHKDNPVHWQEWSDEVLQMAKDQNKCLLISVGYSACHWCHVMAHESFEDKEVAKIMNEHFINIKIDREERPDIDQVYMDAAQILTGRGGWPLNAFALPDGKPFYAGTYFPKENWIKILKNIAGAYQEQADTIVKTANRLTEGINTVDVFEAEDSTETLSEKEVLNSYRSWFKHIDFKDGGLDKAPKFPMPCVWQSLLEYYAFSKDEKALEAVEVTLDKMYIGGIYDWVEGGFARYSVDGEWFAPHFEKMLYDNAQLVSLYADAYKLTKKLDYKTCIEETLNFLDSSLKHPELGYYSALDADTEGEEGLYYTWTYNELKEILTSTEFDIACQLFNIKPRGNWENQRSILAQVMSNKELAEKFEMKESELSNILKSIRQKLKSNRQHSTKPGLDHKLITAHNAMMIKALSKAYQALGNESYKESALRLADVLLENALDSDYNLRRLVDQSKQKGFLDDYTFLIEGLIIAYEISFDIKYLQKAEKLVEYCMINFFDQDKQMFYYASKDSNLISRKIEFSDNVIPSSNAVMAHNLWRLGHLLSKIAYTDLAKEMLNKVQHLYDKYSLYFSTWHQLHLATIQGQIEVAVTGPKYDDYARALQQHYFPFTLFCGGQEERLPQLKNKVTPKYTQIFICQNKTCSSPQTNVKESIKMLNGLIK
jgi:uncharacterized protein YyaL (SSP411 family)